MCHVQVLQPDGGWWRFPDADRLTTDGDDDDGLELAEADQLSAPEIGDDNFTTVDQQARRLPMRLSRPRIISTQPSSEAVRAGLLTGFVDVLEHRFVLFIIVERGASAGQIWLTLIVLLRDDPIVGNGLRHIAAAST